MIRYTCFLLLFLPTSASAGLDIPGPLPEQIFRNQWDPSMCGEDLAECASYRFPETSRVDLSFVTLTRGEDACDVYWQLVSDLRNEDLFRFLNRGAILLAEDFGTSNAPDWRDMLISQPSAGGLPTTAMPQGLDRVRRTIELQGELSRYAGTTWQARFSAYVGEVESMQSLEGVTYQQSSEVRQQKGKLLELLHTNGLPFVAYRARMVSTEAVSSNAAMIPELLGVVDEKHWLLGRKMLDCQFVVDVLYVMALDPPLFRHRLSIGIAPYCGDRRVRREWWQRYPINAERYQKWRESLSKRIVETYRRARKEDPFLRIKGLDMILEVGEQDQTSLRAISQCPMPW